MRHRAAVMIPKFFDPSILSLSAWFRGSYSAPPWAGTASAGGSGSVSLADPGTADPRPTVQALNSINVPYFDGTDDWVGNTVPLSTIISATGYELAMLIKVDQTANTDWSHGGGEVMCDANNRFSVRTTTYQGANYLMFGHRDASDAWTGFACPITLGRWALCFMGARNPNALMRRTWDDAGQVTTYQTTVGIAPMPGGSLTGNVLVGKNHDATKFFKGTIGEIWCRNSSASDLFNNSFNIRNYCRTRYSLPLPPIAANNSSNPDV